MKKLTKKQRNRNYKKAINALLETTSGIKSHYWGQWLARCICHAIGSACHNDSDSVDSFIINYDEFLLFEPKETSAFWFSDSVEREVCLLFCIEMTR